VPSVLKTGPGCSITYGEGMKLIPRARTSAATRLTQPTVRRRERGLVGAGAGWSSKMLTGSFRTGGGAALFATGARPGAPAYEKSQLGEEATG
ncbi:MAG: hypothetical protein JWR01_2456, partial [Subtercola sp.]|nr:hypothetical protein [Subtercola sp.]